MILTPEHAENLYATLVRLEQQGLPAHVVLGAQECTEKALALVHEYGQAGMVALALTAGTLDNYLHA